MHKAVWIVLMLPLVTIATTFQNCSKVEFAATKDLASTTGQKSTMYQEAVVGQASVPPLKLIFVVDNSFTMQANQISLASAFGSMFSGANASNLAPFDSTAYVFTTSQISLAKSNAAFSLLPTLSYQDMRSMSASNLGALRGLPSAQVDGKFAGDLVSYSVSNLPDPVTMLNRLSYVPTPVLGIDSTGADPVSLGAHKDKTGSVSDFAADFSQRIAYISPTRSKVDSSGHGVLDPVIDHESGLCALARVLKNNSNFLKKGDLAAFVIVSDEDDNDPSGSQCIDAYQDYKDADLIDAHCETPRTKLSYNAPNTVTPTCKFDYQKGFTYTASYNSPITKIGFSEYQHTNTNARTKVSYQTVSYTYTTGYSSTIKYYVSNPTYKLNQVKVSWYTKSQSCKERDGVKYDCVDVFTPRSATTEGTYTSSNCSSYSSIASGAVTGDSAHPITCSQATAISKSGACPTSNPNAVDCDPGYTAKTASASSSSASPKCSDLYSQLPSGALTSGVASQYLPTCGSAVEQRSSAANGFCASANKPGCAEALKSVSKTVNDVAYDGSNSSCQAAVTAAKLPNYAASSVVGATNGPTCANTNYTTNDDGQCPTTNPAGVISCTDSQVVNSAGLTKPGAPSGSQTCLQFAQTNGLPSNAVSSSVTCTMSTTPSSNSFPVTYTSSNYPNLVAKVGDACPADIEASVKSTYGSSATCKITSVSNSTKTYQDTCANSASSIASFCAMNSPNHGCTTAVDNNSSVNQPYQTSLSTKYVDGTITCETKCSDAYGACGTVTTGLVKDVFYNCQATADTPTTSNPQTGVLASMKDSLCAAPAKVVVEKSYQRNGTATQFVAGSSSGSGDPNALINYIKSRSAELLGSELPATSVFVRQSDGGSGGTEGKAYKAFAAAMGGSNFDVTSSASVYASSLQSLGGVIKDKLNRSFSIQGFTADQVVTRAWYRASGTSEWIEKQEGTDWTASGGTITVSQAMDIHAGDSFRFEYQ
jgi:hypothetical protein